MELFSMVGNSVHATRVLYCFLQLGVERTQHEYSTSKPPLPYEQLKNNCLTQSIRIYHFSMEYKNTTWRGFQILGLNLCDLYIYLTILNSELDNAELSPDPWCS